MTEALWYLARGTGFAALLLFTAAVVAGVLTRDGRPVAGVPRFAVALVHRNAGLMGSVFTLVHVVTLLFDPYAQLSLVDLVVPFTAEYRPFWTGLGVLAFDLLLAVVATSLLRTRLGLKGWKAVHLLSYALWPFALVHAVGSGTDGTDWWMLATAGACLLAFAAALAACFARKEVFA